MTSTGAAQHPPTGAGPVGDGRRRDGRRTATIVAVLLAVALTSAAVLRSSLAVVTATTANEGNRISTSVLRLDTNVSATLIDVTDLAPGDTERRCVLVGYEGTTSEPPVVRFHIGGMDDPAGLAPHLQLQVTAGDPGTSCSADLPGTVLVDSTLAAAAATHPDHISGAGDWRPQDEEVRPHLVSVTLDRDTPTTLNGAAITDLELVWEVTP